MVGQLMHTNRVDVLQLCRFVGFLNKIRVKWLSDCNQA